jgi:hypothetical protein
MQCSGWTRIELPIPDSDLDPYLQYRYGSGSRAMKLASDYDRKF